MVPQRGNIPARTAGNIARNWSFVSSTDELKNLGDYVTCAVANQSIVVVRDLQGDLRGFLNLCRHRASPLSVDKKGCIRQFTCPYHAWSYQLDGRLKHAPGFELPGDVLEDLGLIPVQVSVWNDLVFACLDLAGISLQDWLGEIIAIARDFPAVAEMKFTGMRSGHCHANWKNYSDNSAEGYHLATVHRELNASLSRAQPALRPMKTANLWVSKSLIKQKNLILPDTGFTSFPEC